MRIFWMLVLLSLASLLEAENLVENGDFSANGGSLTGWTITDATELETDGDNHVAYLHGENGVLYQKITNIEAGKTYECSINIKSATFKQTTGYGYAVEKGSAISFPEFSKGSSQLNSVCTGNNGIWQTLDEDIDEETIRKYTIIIPDGATAIYLGIGTKGAVAKLSVNSVSLIKLEDQKATFNVKKSDGSPIANADVRIGGIAINYLTGEEGKVEIDLPSSEIPYNFTIECDWYKQFKGSFIMTSEPKNIDVHLENIQEVKKVETRISKYGENATPYPLYGHFWTSGMNFTDEYIDTITSAFDYIIGGGGLSSDTAVADKMHSKDPNFHVIRYNGGWTTGRSFAEKYKLDLGYYRCGKLGAIIDESATSFVVNAPPNSKGKGIIACEPDQFDVWIRLENELMKVTQVSSTQSYPITVTVERGYDGTKAARHDVNTTVTLPLYGVPPEVGGTGSGISYFISCSGARKHKLQDAIFNAIDLKHEDGIWIDILLGRLNASSLFNNQYEEWDHQTETLLSGEKDVEYVKTTLNDLYTKFYSRRGFYPVIYGNNVLFSSNYNEAQRAFAMEKTEQHPRGMDGFCHENSWGHMSSDESGVDNEGEVVVSNDKATIYGSNNIFLEWYINNKWVNNCKAVALLAQQGLPNQPMTINAGYKNQWFAENLTDETRYDFNKYAYASYLLCVDVANDSLISCRMGISPMVKKGENVSMTVQPYFYYPIGVPVEKKNYSNFTQYRYQSENLYSREFSKGLVLVNPFASDMQQAVSIANITATDDEFIDPENNNEIISSVQLNSRETKILLLKDDTGISGSKIKGSFKVYPSPANDFISIELEQSIFNNDRVVLIYNVAGQMVKSENVQFDGAYTRVDISDLNKGVYVIKMKDAQFSGKFIKN